MITFNGKSYGWGDWEDVDFSTLVGKTFNMVEKRGEDEIVFANDSEVYIMTHIQDCCENVTIEDICGDLVDIQGSEILMASENSNSGDLEYGDSFTWTFYNISTNKGSVTIRWYGTSNGWYSERVNLARLKNIVSG